MNMKEKHRIIPGLLLLTAAVFLLVFAASGYRADDAGMRALQSDSVIVEETDFGWRFDGPAADAALIFYPGARVDAAAYAPLLHRLAERDMDVFLVNMPLRLALFGRNRADGVMERYAYERWYIGGHSLGGVMAASYAASHDLQGVILLASYPAQTVDEPMLLVYGTEDGVLNMDRVREASRFGAVEVFAIEGGNHANFGSYGAQAGDNAAALSAEEQQSDTVSAITEWLS